MYCVNDDVEIAKKETANGMEKSPLSRADRTKVRSTTAQCSVIF